MAKKLAWQPTDLATTDSLDSLMHDIGFVGKYLFFIGRRYALEYLSKHPSCTMGVWHDVVCAYMEGFVEGHGTHETFPRLLDKMNAAKWMDDEGKELNNLVRKA